MNLIDRRLNPSGKSLPNRQKFLRRARKVIRDAVHQVSGARSIREADEPGVVLISAGGIEEPSFRLGSQGIHDRVLAGNRQFNEGDRIPRPPGSGSGGGSQGAGEGESEDQYTVALSAEEFLHFFLEDLELPDLERRTLSSTESEGLHRAGYAFSGSPANLAIGRTMRNSLTRRIHSFDLGVYSKFICRPPGIE